MEFSATPPGIRLHLMQERDLVAYKQLRDTMIAAHEDSFTSDAATERQRSAYSYRSRLGRADDGGQAGASSPCLFTLCAWQGPRLVGAVSCEGEARSKLRHTVHLIGMMVADDCMGQGIGLALLESTLRLLRADDELEQVLLTVTSSNTGAVRLYRRVGFERYGQLPQALKCLDGRYLDKDLMRLNLRSSPRG
jgi:ribosomal protein S18 acetylase RimI-like enzyme